MCRFAAVLASRCKCPLSYYYDLCSHAPKPDRCPTKTSSIDAYEIDNTKPFCTSCRKAREDAMYEAFYEQRREKTRQAREIDWPNEHVSELRKGMRDDLYEKLKTAYKPLPALPEGSLDRSNPDVRTVEKELNAKGYYIQGGNKPS